MAQSSTAATGRMAWSFIMVVVVFTLMQNQIMISRASKTHMRWRWRKYKLSAKICSCRRGRFLRNRSWSERVSSVFGCGVYFSSLWVPYSRTGIDSLRIESKVCLDRQRKKDMVKRSLPARSLIFNCIYFALPAVLPLSLSTDTDAGLLNRVASM